MMNIPESPIFSYHFVPGHSPFISQTNKMKCKSFSPIACVPDVDDNLNSGNMLKIFRKPARVPPSPVPTVPSLSAPSTPCYRAISEKPLEQGKHPTNTPLSAEQVVPSCSPFVWNPSSRREVRKLNISRPPNGSSSPVLDLFVGDEIFA